MTHINAYIAAVSEAETKVAEAQAELEGAKKRLNDKQSELGLLELEPESTPDGESVLTLEEPEEVSTEPEAENSEPEETVTEPEDSKA